MKLELLPGVLVSLSRHPYTGTKSIPQKSVTSKNETNLELRGLHHCYGEVTSIHGISLEVGRGEIFGYLGPNGAGKTTTVKILTGILTPASGDALVGGYSIIDDPQRVKARIGYVPESGALFHKLSPMEYLGFLGGLHDIPPNESRERAERWLDYFGLSEQAHRRIHELSKGNKQKVCWAAALLHDPDVLVLDEPLSGLDVETVSSVKELLRDYASTGRTVFYSSHLIDIVERVCTRIGILGNGRLLGTGTVDEIVSSTAASSLEEALMTYWRA